ncbi:MAG: hypothetical protein G5Z42_05230 [Caldisphaeraceae archaeon]|nr:hypothetical protein [Caldisphaeraceae archaeon]MEB2793788.1 hypothetical protein [Caldisphaeraceae archaeon]MEB3692351.1 hypothetical protein [Caldisphaeraceae archaeon]MEB3798204.1 hypothetical protein [Caldisphaeraceae archaeon]
MQQNPNTEVPEVLRDKIAKSNKRKVVSEGDTKKEIITIDNPEYISLPCRCGTGRYCCYCDNGVCVAICQSGPEASGKETFEKINCSVTAGRIGYCLCTKDSDCSICCSNFCPT